MEELLNAYLPIFINILLCILVIFLIIICVKIIKTMNKLEDMLEDVEKKVKSLNGIFKIVDGVTDKLSTITEVVTDSVILFIKSIFKKRKNKIKEEDENE